MDRFQELIGRALPRKKSSASLRRKRSDASMSAETPSDQLPRELKSAPYRHARYERELAERGSFLRKPREGVSAETEQLLQRLRNSPQTPPEDTLFRDDLFDSTLELIKNKNEARVIRDIAQLIVPPAEILALRGARHLDILRETTNAGWNNCIPFYGPRPQPDYGLGFKREAFTKPQLQKLQPFIGVDLDDLSFFAATDDMYFPFLTCEVKCGAGMLDVADRQNAHSQTVSLRGIFNLFRVVGRQQELSNNVLGFSFSHSDAYVRIFGHILTFEDDEPRFFRELIADFSISRIAEADNRWIGLTVTKNILDLWVPDHFKRLCTAVDDLPANLDLDAFDFSERSDTRPRDSDIGAARSGLSQQLRTSDLVGEEEDIQQATPTSTERQNLEEANSQRKRRG